MHLRRSKIDVSEQGRSKEIFISFNFISFHFTSFSMKINLIRIKRRVQIKGDKNNTIYIYLLPSQTGVS